MRRVAFNQVRFMSFVVVTAFIPFLAAAAAFWGVSAQVMAAEGQVRRAVAPPVPGGYYMSGMWSIRLPGVREEIGLNEEQDKKIQAIGQKYSKEVQAPWKGLQDLEPAERQKKYRELRDKQQALMQAAHKESKGVLSDDQWDKLMLLQVRRRGPWMLNQPIYQKQLSITDEQKASIDKRMTQMQEKMKALQAKMQKLREKTGEEIFELLTDEQLNKLKEMESSGRPYAVGGQAAGGRPGRIQIRRAPKAEGKSENGPREE